MRMKYSTTDASLDEFDHLPRIPLVLRSGASNRQKTAICQADRAASILALRWFTTAVYLRADLPDRQTAVGNFAASPLRNRGQARCT